MKRDQDKQAENAMEATSATTTKKDKNKWVIPRKEITPNYAHQIKKISFV